MRLPDFQVPENNRTGIVFKPVQNCLFDKKVVQINCTRIGVYGSRTSLALRQPGTHQTNVKLN